MMRLILTGGGTGGHIAPLLGIIDSLKTDASSILYIGGGNPEQKIITARQIPFQKIAVGKLRRYPDWRNVRDIFRVIQGVKQARKILREFRPDVILGTGGYITLPVGLAAWREKIPFVLFDSDAVPGLANRILGRFAKKICLNYPGAQKYFSQNKTAITGLPVRSEILAGDKTRGLKFLNFSARLPILLIMGGSQGARNLNELTREILPDLLKKFQVAHLVGKNKKFSFPQNPRYRQFEFLEREFADVLAVADLAIARAGASSLAELAAVGLPSILLPLPSAANNHQLKNARVFADAGAAKLLEEKNTSPQKLLTDITALLESDPIRQKMKQSARTLFVPDAAERILREVERAGGK